MTELFDRITEMNNTDDTEYEEDDFDAEAYQEDDTPEPEFVGEARGVEAYPRQNILINPIVTTPRGGFRGGPSVPVLQQPSYEFADRGATSRLNAQIAASTVPPLPHGHPPVIRLVADVLPVVESPISPPPSDVASNHSIGTNNSNGAGFFRVYHERSTMSVSPRGYGTLTPDLNYAEIGHGRGAQQGLTDPSPTSQGSIVRASTRMQYSSNHDRTPRQPTVTPPNVTQQIPHPSNSQGSSESEEFPDNVRQNISLAGDKTWSYHEASSNSPATRELQASVQSALGVERRGRRGQPELTQNAERRARSVKRSIRNTFQAAEHYASSLLFGRSSEDTQVEGSSQGSGTGSGSRS